MEFIIDEFNRLVKVKNISKKDTKIVIPDGVETIGQSCFFAHKNIKEIILPKSVKVIERMAFQDCLYLNKINLPESLKLIEEYAFNRCKSLEKINLPNSIKNIESSAFYECSKLEEISLPQNLTCIRYQTFSQCDNLKKLYIPKSIQFIEGLAFMDCSNIEKITCDNMFAVIDHNLQHMIQKLPHIYFNKDKESFIFSNELIETSGYEEVNYYEIQKMLKCKPSVAALISLNLDEKELKKAKSFKKIIAEIINDNYKPKHNDLIAKLKNNKEFEKLIKHIYKSKRIRSNQYYDIFKLAYSLGAFNENKIERQKACEFLANAFDKKTLVLNKMHKIFNSLNFDGYKGEWATFFMDKNNFLELMENEKKHPGYISKIYNSFEEIKEFGKSNKGKQRYRKVTIEMCDKYNEKLLYKNISEENMDIAEVLKKYTRDQEVFNEAIMIRQEYEKAKQNNGIHDHILEEELKDPIFDEILKEKETIISDANTTLNNLNQISNKHFTYEYLSKNDPHNFVLGKYCDCCAHLEGAGEGVVIASILNPDCQNIVIRNSKGNIISKSTIYVNRTQGYALLNTIQTSSLIKSKEDKISIYNKYIEAINAFVEKYNKKNPSNPLTQVNIGMHLNDAELIIRKNHDKSKKILQGINFITYNNYIGHQGDWQKEQYILLQKNENKKQVK